MDRTTTKVRQARAAQQLTQSDLSERSGVPQKTLSNLENRGAPAAVTALLRVAMALGTTVEALCERPRGVSKRSRGKREQSRAG